MAVVIPVERLEALLAASRGADARLAWIEGGRLRLGPAIGTPAFELDMGAETLVRLVDTRDMGRTRSPAVGRDLDTPCSHDDGDGLVARRPADRVTSLPEQYKLPAFPGRQTGSYRIALEGKIYAARSQKELLLLGLSAIERAQPGTLAILEQEKTRTKRVVSRRRETLNDDPRLAMRFSERIEGEWWVFTNNSFPETEKFLRRAARHAALHVEIERAA